MSQVEQAGKQVVCLPGGTLSLKPFGGLVMTPEGLAIDCNQLVVLCNLKQSNSFSDSNICGINWSVTPTQVGQNQAVTVQMAGLRPLSSAIILITGPGGSSNNYQVIADNTGTVTAQVGSIVMDGPEGNYAIKPLVPGCKLDP